MNIKEITAGLEELLSQKSVEFVPGETEIQVASQYIDLSERLALCEVALSGKFSEGEKSRQFLSGLSDYVGRKGGVLCNSGSSASLVAITALMNKFPDRKTVITCATGFPTTVNPILQNGGEVLFVDADKKTLNPCLWQVMEALSFEHVGGVILAHTLGFPFNAELIRNKCDELGKWFIEDTCDALGGTWTDRSLGTFGHANTYSFYPAHHISMGEGGAVLSDDLKLIKEMQSLVSWGRDCWCEPGHDNTCGKRFLQSMGKLPPGYDHKYIYSNLGYNLKLTDMQAALGLAQLNKLPHFTKKRRDNYQYLLDGLYGVADYYDTVSYPDMGMPSPFGFPLIVKEHTHLNKSRLIKFLENRKIRTRPVFAGNITKHPAYINCKDKWSIRWVLDDSDWIMENVFWIGCHPNMTRPMMDYVIESLYEFACIVQ